MSWRPRLISHGTTLCVDDGEFEGWTIGVEWRGKIVQWSLLWRERQL